MKTAIIIGHTKLKPGACSPWGLPCEFELNKQIAEAVAEFDLEVDVFEHESYKYGYKYMTRRTASRINKGDYDLVLELHYNAAHPSAHGAEALYYFRNPKARELALRFSLQMAAKMGYRNRGAKALVNEKDRGFWAVFYPNPTTLILEPFFGTNKDDVSRFDAAIYVSVILNLISYYKRLK